MLTIAKRLNYNNSTKTRTGGIPAPLDADIFISKNASNGKNTPVSRIREVRGAYPVMGFSNTGAFLSTKQKSLQIINWRRAMPNNSNQSFSNFQTVPMPFQHSFLAITPDKKHSFLMSTAVIELKEKFYAIKNDYNIENLFNRLDRVIVNPQILNADDFINFVNEYKSNSTKLFYNTRRVRAIFNYPLPSLPSYGDSFAELELEPTNEFQSFKNIIGEELSQQEFIKFLKKIEPLITSHDSVSILEIAKNLSSIKKINSISDNTRNAVSLDCEIGRSKGLENIKLPTRFEFTMPIFKATDKVLTTFQVELFVRFDDGNFHITVECWKFDKIVEDATRAIVHDIVESIEGVPAFMS